MTDKTVKSKNICCIFLWSILFVILTAADRITKMMAYNNLKDNDSVVVIKGFLSLTYVENKGAAWGIMSGRINLLAIATIIIIPFLIFLFIRAWKSKKYFDLKKSRYLTILQLDMILLLAGAVGNFIDRILMGFVVDFFQFTFIDFPVFNVADCYITAGAFIFVIIYIFVFKSDEDIDIILKGKKASSKKEKSYDEA
ncbi:MAG: signal peptidase II [Lachnospiraceae bacterium]